MGMVFGIQREEEPAYTVQLDRSGASGASFPYEIRSYGQRFAIEASFDADGQDKSPFMKLAGYIGVLSDPQNEGETKIAMTAPVAMQRDDRDGGEKKKKGTPIAMTAPVAMQRDGGDDSNKKMQFFLPSKYDSMDKIPKPTNPDVTVKTVPPSIGAVHRYSGTFSETKSKAKATQLIEQLKSDGLTSLDENKALDTYQFFGYNPPFTIPIFRRNEVFVELTAEQVEELKTKIGGGETSGATN
mmetsp:Transcript_5864/g.12757  ORF Transcript_5864/g.12757 Transcript_5864/m.12757 type:complete len:242 (-) Transcript_5864:105-830(-)